MILRVLNGREQRWRPARRLAVQIQGEKNNATKRN